VVGPAYPGLALLGAPNLLMESFPEGCRQVIDGVRGWPGARARFDASLADIRDWHPLPSLRGSVDVYSFDQQWLAAYGLAWRPRPIFQSYQVTSAALAAINADAVRDHGPEWIVWNQQVIDGHYPTLDDGPVWLEVLRHYDVWAEPGPVVFRRRRAAREVGLEPIGAQEVWFGDRIAVPPLSDGPVWVTIAASLNGAGRLARALYKTPQMFLEVEDIGGDRATYRIPRGMAAAGFLLSPTIHRPNGVADLLAPDWQNRLSGFGVATIAVTGARGVGRVTERPIVVSFSRVRMVREEPSPELPFQVLDACVPTRVTERNQVALSASDDGLVVDASGGDPFFVPGVIPPSPDTAPRALLLDLELEHPDIVQVFFRAPGSPASEEHAASVQAAAGRRLLHVWVPSRREPLEVRLDVGSRPGKCRVHGIAVAPATEGGLPAQVAPVCLGTISPNDPTGHTAFIPRGPVGDRPNGPVVPLAAGRSLPQPGGDSLTMRVAPLIDAVVTGEGATVIVDGSGPDPAVSIGPFPGAPVERLLTIDVELPSPNLLQVFSRHPGIDEFTEERSIAYYLPSGRQLVRVPIGPATTPVELRLDPGTRPGRYVVRGLWLDPPGH
jgi:hypothetical protein